MQIPYYQIDAFTTKLFSGNPAGVCWLADWLPDDILQSIAAENNLAETAFFVQRESLFDLRWFTPTTEVDLCGHATLAAAHVIFEHLGYKTDRIRFETRSGLLTVTREQSKLTLNFPAWMPVACPPPADLVNGLGKTPLFTGKSRDYFAVFDSEDTIRSLAPDMAVLSRLDSIGIIATAPGEHCDFVSRFFAPQAGVPEDPVTGSAHCTLIPYWAHQLGRSKLHARQISARGGELFCEMVNDRVHIGGQAVTYQTGYLQIALPDRSPTHHS